MAMSRYLAPGILVASISGSCGYYLYDLKMKSTKPQNDDFVFFPPTSTNERISEGLQTGDMLVFQRGMPPSFCWRSVLTFLSRGASRSPWDHVAVVVRDHDPKNDIPYVLEAGANGVQFLPFDERILKSKSNVIALRRLSLPADVSRDLIAMDLAKQAFKEQQYRISWRSLIWSYGLPVSKEESPVRKAWRSMSIGDEIDKLIQQHTAMTKKLASMPALSPATSELEHRRNTAAHVLSARVRESEELKLELNHAQSQPPRFSAAEFPDIQLAVWFYQQLGILPLYPYANEYTYKDFVHETGGKLPLIQPASFSNEVYIKA